MKRVLELVPSHASGLTVSTTFAVRTVELRRSADETRFFLNGKPLYLRGATYWPDLYLSNMSRVRYEREHPSGDARGYQRIRVHVHTEDPEFYELCDRLGIALIQDNDLNWVFPTDVGFTARAVRHFGALVEQLRNHPSIIAWVAMNEVGDLNGVGMPQGLSPEGHRIGAQLVSRARQLDPTRPVIQNSIDKDDLASGDEHDYRGSLMGGKTTYFDIFADKSKLVTEFGVDAPPALTSLRVVPRPLNACERFCLAWPSFTIINIVC